MVNLETTEIKYWCNANSDVILYRDDEAEKQHRGYFAEKDENGNYFDEKIPENIRELLNKFWSFDYEMLCYVVELHGKEGILLMAEISCNKNFKNYKNCLKVLELTFPDYTIVYGQNTGYGLCHQIGVFLPRSDSMTCEEVSRCSTETTKIIFPDGYTKD